MVTERTYLVIGRSNRAKPKKLMANAAQEQPTTAIDVSLFRNDCDVALIKSRSLARLPGFPKPPTNRSSPIPVHYGTQSARNTLNSPGSFACRSDTQTRRLPSGENMGKLLKCPSMVRRSNPVPSSRTKYRWKLGRPLSPLVSMLEEKMMRVPSG